MRSLSTLPRFARLAAPVVAVALVVSAIVGYVFWSERSGLAAWSRKSERFVPRKAGREVFYSPGVKTPSTLPSDRAPLGEDEPIIGVEAGGKFRAYHDRTMSAKARHVVNDVVGGKAVTVTFCDLNDCARAYGGADSSSPLDIALAGLSDGGMLLSVKDVAYYQGTAELADPPGPGKPPRLPYPPFPVTRTTWGRWKSLHPETDLYLNMAP